MHSIFLLLSGDPCFMENKATVKFLRIFDKLFNIVNSRSSSKKDLKLQ